MNSVVQNDYEAWATRRLPICCQGRSCIVCVVAEHHCQPDTRRSSGGAHFLQPIIDRYPFHSSFENLISRLQGGLSCGLLCFPLFINRHVRRWVKYISMPWFGNHRWPSILKWIISQEITTRTVFRCKTEIYDLICTFYSFVTFYFINLWFSELRRSKILFNAVFLNLIYVYLQFFVTTKYIINQNIIASKIVSIVISWV